MKTAYLTILVLMLSWAARPSFAQDMSFDLDETADAKSKTKGSANDSEGMSFSEDEAESGASAEGEVDVIGALAGEDASTANDDESLKLNTKEVREEIYAVQQIYALRLNRLELAPSLGFSFNDQFVSHNALGLAANYWWTNVLALGLNFLWYQGLENESDLNFHVRRSTRLGVPITEYQMGANLNFTYVPLYGKFGMFNNNIFQWDMYVVGGLGFMRTRPVPVVDPEYRQFDFNFRLAFNAGMGIRIFVTRFLAVFGEIRDYAYLEQLESLDVPVGTDQRRDPDTWLADSASLTNNVMVQLGVTIFFPFTFDYHLPK